MTQKLMDEIYLEPEGEIIENAKQIAEASRTAEKHIFCIKYEATEKPLVLSEIKRLECEILEQSDSKSYVTVRISMAQLVAIKSLNCIEKVETTDKNIGITVMGKPMLQRAESNGKMNTEVVDEQAIASVQSIETVLPDNEISTMCYGGGSGNDCDYSNTMQTAYYLPLATWVKGYIYCPGTEVWYKFTANASNTSEYTIYTSGSLDTMGYLYDSCGTLIASNDDSCGSLNFSIIGQLTYGATYYVKVKAYGSNTGVYDIRVSDTTQLSGGNCDSDCSNGQSSAIQLTLNCWQNGEICCPCAEMWYKFTPSTTAYYTICSGGSLDTVGYLYDSDSNQINGDDDAGSGLNFRMVHHLTANQTYYIKVRMYGNNTGYFSVAVINTVFVESVTIDDTYVMLNKGETTELSATISPFYATNKTLRWESGDTGVVTVNPSTGKITAVNRGSACVCAYSQDGSGKSSCCEVVVNVLVESVTVDTPTRIMHVGTNARFTATVCPDNANNKLLCWTSTNTAVASVDSATGYVTAKAVGTADIYATAQDGTGKQGVCALTVEPAIPVQSITMCCDTHTMSVGETTYLSYNIHPADATNQSVVWCSSDTSVAEVDLCTGYVAAKKAGTTTITATTNDGSFVASCFIIVRSKYQNELINSCGFSEDESEMIISLYDRIDNIYSSHTWLERAWRCARLLSEFCFDYYTTKAGVSINTWDDAAGSVTTEENRQSYFINTLGYTEQEYIKIHDALLRNRQKANADGEIIDFTHMQYSLAARLAYTLHKDGKISDWGSGLYTGNIKKYTNEEVSYLAGWLGDAVLTNAYGIGTTVLRNDDYMSDLDAENIYQIIIQGNNSIEAINTYYSQITVSYTRADIFLQHIPYSTVKSKIFYELIDAELYWYLSNSSSQGDIVLTQHYLNLINNEQYHFDTIKASYPDTYDFLKSLNDRKATMAHYQ